jgi:hypothetical protein
MLQWISGSSLKSETILVDLPLRNDVFLEKIVIGKAAAQVVVMPMDLTLDPRFILNRITCIIFDRATWFCRC